MVWFLSRLEGVVRVDLYSVVCVRDRTASQKWFEVFFGRPSDHVIGEELLWQVGENAYVVIDDRSMRAARAGGTMITLGVTDLDDILARLDAHGIGHEPVHTYGGGVRHVEVLDPDGNSLSLAETPARLPRPGPALASAWPDRTSGRPASL
jgi:catechol 2,3-dioxygenase-like lactoylglutathione lyase family enzyme